MSRTSYLVLPPGSRCYADPLAMNAAAIGEPVALVSYPDDTNPWRTGAISRRPTLDRMDGDSPVLRFENDDSMTWLGASDILDDMKAEHDARRSVRGRQNRATDALEKPTP